jgi:hypothetical protein
MAVHDSLFLAPYLIRHHTDLFIFETQLCSGGNRPDGINFLDLAFVQLPDSPQAAKCSPRY